MPGIPKNRSTNSVPVSKRASIGGTAERNGTSELRNHVDADVLHRRRPFARAVTT